MTDSPASTPKPPRRYLRPRTIIFWTLIFLLISGPWLLQRYRVNQIPLIPDPFDFEKFSEPYYIPDSENAYVEYRQAVEQLQERQEWRQHLQPKNIAGVKWENAPEEVKTALSHNEKAIELWLKGTGKPRAILIPPDQLQIDYSLEVAHKLLEIVKLVQWTQIRLQDSGMLDESWKFINAGQRTSVHLISGSTLLERLVGINIHSLLIPNLARWSEDPQVTVDQLRTALKDVRGLRLQVPPASQNIKAEYRIYRDFEPKMRRGMIENPNPVSQRSLKTRFYDFFRGPLTDFGYQMIGEYELSSRYMRHWYSNILTYADRPIQERDSRELSWSPFLIFENKDDPDASFPAVRLAEIGESSPFIKSINPAFSQYLSACDRDKLRWDAEELILALQIYHRERGSFPAELKLLIPEYLKELPVNPYADEPGGTFHYRVETDHVLFWTEGDCQSVPLEAGPFYSLPNAVVRGRNAMCWTTYPPGTRPPLYRPYPAGYEDAMKQKAEEEEKWLKKNPPVFKSR